MRSAFSAVLIAGAAILAGSGPALAAADGLPVLDPSNGVFGTVYDFVLPGHASPLDPAQADMPLSWGGQLYIYQNGSPVLEAYFHVDADRDGLTDRTLTCDGIVGSGRYALHCYDDDGLGNLELLLRGRANVLPDGRVSLRKTSGRGYTDDHVLTFGFQGTQQLP